MFDNLHFESAASVGPRAETRSLVAPAQVKPRPGNNGGYSFSKQFVPDSSPEI